jgi:hypothetical protein
MVYRGQRNANWGLTSALHRTPFVRNVGDMIVYINQVLPVVQEAVEGWTGKSWNLSTELGLAEFLAYLQHNGFPTPILDWTSSPFIAAYFAFEGVDSFSAQRENVAIYCFDEEAWIRDKPQSNDVANERANVSMLRPRIVGNHKLAAQQGCFTWSNVVDIEAHIRANEDTGTRYLTKYEIAAAERPDVMRELSLMGISAVQLMPSVEAVCKKAFEDMVARHLEPTPKIVPSYEESTREPDRFLAGREYQDKQKVLSFVPERAIGAVTPSGTPYKRKTS